MTGTPIPAGALEVDDEPDREGAWPNGYAVRVDGDPLFSVTRSQRARLLAGPARPDGVPDDAVDARVFVTPEDEDDRCEFYSHTGQRIAGGVASWWRSIGVPVPPCQPTPPAAEPTELCGALHGGRRCILPARHNMGQVDIPENHQFDPPPVTEARTGPDAVAEARHEAAKHRAIQARLRAGDDLAMEERIIASNPFPWEAGVPVPPYQPDPDPEALLNEKIAVDWTTPDPADEPPQRATGICGCMHPWDMHDENGCTYSWTDEPGDEWCCQCDARLVGFTSAAPPVAGERTGPLGLNEQETRDVAAWAPMGKPGDLHATTHDHTIAACRAAVAEWDAHPEPAETLDSRPDPDTITVNRDHFHNLGVVASIAHEFAAAMAAIERPDPDTVTVNRGDLRLILNVVGRIPSGNAFSNEQSAYSNLRAAMAAAGLPQEPTEGDQQ